jgi:hypothetical protein
MAAAVGVGPAGTQQVVVVVATDPAPRTWRLAPLTLVDRVRAAVPEVDIAAVLVVPELPVDIRHQSKIDRARVSRRQPRCSPGAGMGRRRQRPVPASDHDRAGARPVMRRPAPAASARRGPRDARARHRGMSGDGDGGRP